jgi:acetyl-CoA carboxylase biotin carboxyl carrier protein
MTIDEIKELIELFNESGVAEIEVQRGENRLRLRRAPLRQDYVFPAMMAPTAQGQTPGAMASQAGAGAGNAAGSAGGSAGAAAAPARMAEADSNHILVKSPIVGTYYDQASPGTPPFIRVGDAVEPGQVLCIIESMKLMNEIEAETAGILAAKLVENGRPVEYGEALFAIRPR